MGSITTLEVTFELVLVKRENLGTKFCMGLLIPYPVSQCPSDLFVGETENKFYGAITSRQAKLDRVMS